MSNEEKRMSAREFALNAHGNQMYGEFSYIKHLDDVAELVDSSSLFVKGNVSDVHDAAYLHDSLEDTSADPVMISLLFGPKVLALVEAVTKTPGLSRKAGFKPSMQKIVDTGDDAVLLKLCDRVANVNSCIMTNHVELLKMYRAEHAGFVKMLRKPGDNNPKWSLLDMLFMSTR